MSEDASRPILVGRAVLLYHGRILLGFRADASRWECPGGKIEDESIETGVRRELLEETGITAHGDLELVGYYDGLHLTKRRRYADIFLAIPDWSGTATRLEEKHLEWRWVDLTDAKKLALMPSTRHLLNNLWPAFAASHTSWPPHVIPNIGPVS